MVAKDLRTSILRHGCCLSLNLQYTNNCTESYLEKANQASHKNYRLNNPLESTCGKVLELVDVIYGSTNLALFAQAQSSFLVSTAPAVNNMSQSETLGCVVWVLLSIGTDDITCFLIEG